MESIELTKASKYIQGRMERCDSHQKRLESVDKRKEIIHRLGHVQTENRM